MIRVSINDTKNNVVAMTILYFNPKSFIKSAFVHENSDKTVKVN